MTERMTLNFTFIAKGDKLKIKKEGDYKEKLSTFHPLHGVYLATLVLALDLVVQKDDQLLDVIRLLGSPEEIAQLDSALEAMRELMTLKTDEEPDQN